MCRLGHANVRSFKMWLNVILFKVKVNTMLFSGHLSLCSSGATFELSAGGASWFALHLLACWPVRKVILLALFSSLFPLRPPFGNYRVW